MEIAIIGHSMGGSDYLFKFQLDNCPVRVLKHFFDTEVPHVKAWKRAVESVYVDEKEESKNSV